MDNISGGRHFSFLVFFCIIYLFRVTHVLLFYLMPYNLLLSFIHPEVHEFKTTSCPFSIYTFFHGTNAFMTYPICSIVQIKIVREDKEEAWNKAHIFHTSQALSFIFTSPDPVHVAQSMSGGPGLCPDLTWKNNLHKPCFLGRSCISTLIESLRPFIF